MRQTVLSFVFDVKASFRSDLQALLGEIGQNPAANEHIPFGKLDSLHFAGLAIHDHPTFGSRLIFEGNFDGSVGRFLNNLCSIAQPALVRIFTMCKAFPPGANQIGIQKFMRGHLVKPLAYHIGNLGTTVQQIKTEQVLYEFLERELDAISSSAPVVATNIDAHLRSAVRSAHPWAFTSPRGLSWLEKIVPKLEFAAAALVAIVLILAFLPLVIITIVVLRVQEKTDPVWSGDAKPLHVNELLAVEDAVNTVANHMVSVSSMKPGRLRAFTVRFALAGVNLIARSVFTNGQLGTIGSIHFAHWSLIDGGRSLLFLSNYDGSWQSYLNDFIDKAATGLTGIWSNTVQFPRASFLVNGGARSERDFKAIARDRQIATTVWYCAYPALTVDAILRNASIRAVFSGAQTTSYLGLL